MSSIRLLLLAPAIACIVAACGDGYPQRGYDDNSIVFGISQKKDASGKVETRAGYEFLELANKTGWETHVLFDDNATCIFERLEKRLGKPRVESGAASFTGAALPTNGVAIPANSDDIVVQEGSGWKTNDVLFFEASGFAMPTVPPQRMRAPAAELTISAPPPEGELTIKASEDFTVSWTAAAEEFPSKVMVALETEEPDGRSGEVRCFYNASESSGVVPKLWLTRLLSSIPAEQPIKGKVQIATHRQLTLYARGAWTIYVVATTMHREQPFSMPR
jgi:hypothetical protein